MSGEVLCRYEPREVALTWEEIDAVIGLRVFSVGPGAKLVGAQLSSWVADDATMQMWSERLGSALDRLVRALGGSSASA
jgi:hypothetical protein